MISLDYLQLERIEAEYDFDLLELLDPNRLQGLKHTRLFRMVYAAIADQVEDAGIPEGEFGANMVGCLGDAVEALAEDLIRFLPAKQQRLISKAKDKTEEAQSRLLQKMEERMESTSVEEIVDQSMSKFGQQLMNSSESSDSPSRNGEHSTT